MQTISISQNRFKKFQKLQLDKIIMNTEGELFIISDKEKWTKNPKIVKKLYINDGDNFDNKEKINIEELVIPEKLVIVGGQITGFTMPYINGENLSFVLKNNKFNRKQNIKYLKEIGVILDKMKHLRENGVIEDFYLNDIHEENFMLNNDTGKVNVVDLDSCKINDNKPFSARYLAPCSQVVELSNKYFINEDKSAYGYIIPNENSDLFCYIMIILNYIYDGQINKLSIENYYTYMQYLLDVGFPYELVDVFSKVYEYVDNENPYELLDMLPSELGQASNKVFKKIANIN